MNKKGFTLIELMNVLLIVGILMLVAVPSVLRSKITANETLVRNSLNVIGKSLEMYNNQYLKYPDDINKIQIYTIVDFFDGSHLGYFFTVMVLEDYRYIIMATPIGNNIKVFTMSTGGIINET